MTNLSELAREFSYTVIGVCVQLVNVAAFNHVLHVPLEPPELLGCCRTARWKQSPQHGEAKQIAQPLDVFRLD